MSYSATIYKIMIASPGDVPQERFAIRDVIAEWNAVHAEVRKIVLMPIGWETHANPEMGRSAQAIINEQILHGCDLLVGVFWTRLGTPTNRYPSGSVEEIEEHIGANKPAMLYFSQQPVVPDSIDPKQYQALVSFRDSCRKCGLCETYLDINDFVSKLNRQLQLMLNGEPFSNVEGFPLSSSPEGITPHLARLSAEAEQLLRDAAGKDGQIVHIPHLGGVLVQVGQSNYTEDNSPRTQALWESAISELENAALIAPTSPSRNVLRVTRQGYEQIDNEHLRTDSKQQRLGTRVGEL